MPAPQDSSDDGLAGLAEFLSQSDDGATQDETLEDETQDEAEDGQDQQSDDENQDDAENADDGADKAAQQQPQKIKVKVKTDTGADEEVEVDQDELVKGYQRQSDYTRKTQQIAEQSRQAAEIVQGQIDQARAHYQQQAQLAMATVARVAGLKSAEEMAQLAQADPSAWVQEQQRQLQIQQLMGGLSQQMQGEIQRAQQQAEAKKAQQVEQMRSKAWAELTKANIDRDGVKSAFDASKKLYGFTDAELENVYDHRIVLLMRDAAAYRNLQAKKQSSVKPIGTVAPPTSTQKAPTQQTRQQKAIDARFKGGKANVNDLAAFLAANKR